MMKARRSVKLSPEVEKVSEGTIRSKRCPSTQKPLPAAWRRTKPVSQSDAPIAIDLRSKTSEF